MVKFLRSKLFQKRWNNLAIKVAKEDNWKNYWKKKELKSMEEEKIKEISLS